MVRREAIAAGVVLALGALAIHQSAQLPFGGVRSPGPGFFPWWASVILEGLAVILLGQVLVQRVPAAAGEGGGRPVKVLVLLVVLAAYTLLLETLGYPACTFLLVLFMLRVIDPYRWPLALGLAAFASAGSYVLFATWLKVPLPPGLWVP